MVGWSLSGGDDIDDEHDDKKYSGGAISNNGHDPRRAFRNCKKVRIFFLFKIQRRLIQNGQKLRIFKIIVKNEIISKML